MHQLIKYFGVAVIALAVDYSTRFIFSAVLGFKVLAAFAIGFSFGLVVNYILSMFFVFKKTGKGWLYEFFVFTITGVSGLGLTLLINYLLIYVVANNFFHFLFVNKFGIIASASAIITTGIVFFFSFFSRRIILKLSNK